MSTCSSEASSFGMPSQQLHYTSTHSIKQTKRKKTNKQKSPTDLGKLTSTAPETCIQDHLSLQMKYGDNTTIVLTKFSALLATINYKDRVMAMIQKKKTVSLTQVFSLGSSSTGKLKQPEKT